MTPFRRWLIRSFFLTLLLLWAAAWTVSTRYEAGGGYTRTGQGLGGAVYSGAVDFTWYHGTPDADGWHDGLCPHPFQFVVPDFWWGRDSFVPAGATYSSFRLVGFYYAHYSQPRASDPPYVQHTVGIPFWFLLLVSGITLRWTWRKTRPQPSPATAFPVETPGGHS